MLQLDSSWRPLDIFRSIGLTHRLLSSSCLGLPYRILNINLKKELLRSLWVERRYYLHSNLTEATAQGV